MDLTNKILLCATNLVEKYSFPKNILKRKTLNIKFPTDTFSDIFPNIDNNVLDQIEYASTIYGWSILIIDNLLDNLSYPREKLKDDILLVPILREHALQVMYSIFPSNSDYWKFFNKYNHEYTISCRKEYINHYNKITEYSSDDMKSIMTGLPALIKALPTAMAFLTKKLQYISFIEESINYFHIAVNLKDDVDDWKNDFKNKEYSYLLTTVINKYNISDTIDSISVEDIGKRIFISGIVGEMFNLSLTYFDRSLNAIKELDCDRWRGIIIKHKEKTKSKKDEIEESIKAELFRIGAIESCNLFHKPIYTTKKTLQKIELPRLKKDNPWLQLSIKALKYIFKKSENEFKEASHVMRFPHLDGFQSSHEFQLGNVFSRAIITEILLNANIILNGKLSPLIDREVSFLINIRSPYTNGWCYFPFLEELPDDADTLGQIMQVLYHSGNEKVFQKYCVNSIDWIFNNSYPNGSFETWIIPPLPKRKKIHEKQLQYIKNTWGTRQDVEVIANFLYGLHLFSIDNYSNNVKKGIEFIVQSQESRGYWKSTWYHGPYYGIYVCTRLLIATNSDTHVIARAITYLHSSQKIDGSWGYAEKGDPLNTAFALISLAAVWSYNKELVSYNQVLKGFDFLKKTVNPNGSWDKTNFIKMLVMKNNKPKTLNYSSSTITTAYILKALLAWYECTK